MVIPDALFDFILPQGKYPENFVLISVLEVCQEWWVKKVVTWRKGSSLTSWMTLVDPKDHILKVSYQYLFFGFDKVR